MTTPSEAVLTQLRKGVLDYCALAVLADGPTYGLELANKLAARGTLFSSSGTLYPLLSRLRKQEWVETTWQESPSGPPRRYYQITDAGTQALETFKHVWNPFAADITALLEDHS